MTKLILTDVDDTLLRWSDAFEAFAASKGLTGRRPIGECWNIADWLGIEWEAGERLVHEFQHTEALFSGLEPLEGAVAGVERLVGAGYRFIAITACGDENNLLDWRRANLRRVFGDVFDDIRMVKVHAGKEEHLSAFEPTWWLEDNFRHAVAGAKLGHQSLLVVRPHNSFLHDSRVTPIINWQGIADYILADAA